LRKIARVIIATNLARSVRESGGGRCKKVSFAPDFHHRCDELYLSARASLIGDLKSRSRKLLLHFRQTGHPWP